MSPALAGEFFTTSAPWEKCKNRLHRVVARIEDLMHVRTENSVGILSKHFLWYRYYLKTHMFSISHVWCREKKFKITALKVRKILAPMV